MAAEDQGIQLSVVSTGNIGSKEEERELIEEETALGADGLILLEFREGIRKNFSPGRRSRLILRRAGGRKKWPVSPVWSRIITRWESRWGRTPERLWRHIGGEDAGICVCTGRFRSGGTKMDGVLEALEETGIEVLWHVEGSFEGGDTAFLEAQEAADFVVALMTAVWKERGRVPRQMICTAP